LVPQGQGPFHLNLLFFSYSPRLGPHVLAKGEVRFWTPGFLEVFPPRSSWLTIPPLARVLARPVCLSPQFLFSEFIELFFPTQPPVFFIVLSHKGSFQAVFFLRGLSLRSSGSGRFLLGFEGVNVTFLASTFFLKPPPFLGSDFYSLTEVFPVVSRLFFFSSYGSSDTVPGEVIVHFPSLPWSLNAFMVRCIRALDNPRSPVVPETLLVPFF